MGNKNLIKNILAVIPPLSSTAHKGQAGRIGVIGGCKEYTGAPYFAAISALKSGCDLVHVFCTEEASPVIKCYSPELIVHPILGTPTGSSDFAKVLPRLHSLVVGPGLGRDDVTLLAAHEFINMAKQHQLPIVLDADALFYVTRCPEIIKGYREAILTPNIAEFRNLYATVISKSNDAEDLTSQDHVKDLSNALGNVTVVRKGREDVISDGESTLVCNEPGSPRRCGGQGDILSGSMATFNFWAHNYYSVNASEASEFEHNPTVIAAVAACMLTRKCNWLAFHKHRRSTVTSDMIDEIRTAFTLLFPVD